jgi:putative membrane protein
LNTEIDGLMENPYFETLAYFSVAVLALVIFLAIFEMVTKYKGWEEIKKGNVAVAMAVGGKIFGIGNLFRFAISSKESIYDSLLWAGFGFVLLVLAYFIFEFLTPVFKVDEEIKHDNRAVGLISMMISISLSFVIGSSIGLGE